MAASNRSGDCDLSVVEDVPEGRNVCTGKSDSQSRGVDSGEHRGGHARQHTKEYLQHLSIAKGSLAELDTLLIVAEKLSYISCQETAAVQATITEVRMMLCGLMSRLQSKPSPLIPGP